MALLLRSLAQALCSGGYETAGLVLSSLELHSGRSRRRQPALSTQQAW